MEKTLQQIANEICTDRKEKLKKLETAKNSALKQKDEVFQKYARDILKIFEISNTPESRTIYQVKICTAHQRATCKTFIESSISFDKPPFSTFQIFCSAKENSISTLEETKVSDIIPILKDLDEMSEYYAEIAAYELYKIFKKLENFETFLEFGVLVVSLKCDSK